MKQRSFASLSFESKKKPTRRERFLGEMDKVVPWAALLALIEPSYPTSGRRGRPPMPVSTMLRIHFMQQWYALSDPAMEDALYEIESMRRFAGLELNENPIPDETTILKFRRFLEQHGLAAKILEAVNAQPGHDRGCHDFSGAVIDEEPRQAARSGHAPDQEGSAVVCVTNPRVIEGCFTEDGRRPPEVGLQEQASNRPVLLRSKGAVVSD